MNQTIHAAPPALQSLTQEILIDVSAEFGWAHYQGTASQLIDEGLVKSDFDWPNRTERKCWEEDGFEYSVRRIRPKGYKGSMSSWLKLNHWCFSIGMPDHDYSWCQKRRERAFANTELPLSPKERADRMRYMNALLDKEFQAFKSIFVPDFPKRGRKPMKGTQ